MFIFIIVVAILLLWFLVHWLIIEKKKYPPGPFRLPFLGNIFQINQVR